MEILFMRENQVIVITHNATSTPRIGEKCVFGDKKFEVVEVIWHYEGSRTWVEIQI